MRQVIIHVGPPKTATTYIQEKLQSHRTVLARQGVCYPEVYWFANGQLLLHQALNDATPAAGIRQSLDAACGEAETCLLSGENLFHLDARALDKLAAVFPDVPVRFVLSVRRPSLRVRSLWQERVKHGGRMALGAFLLEHCLRPLTSREVNLTLQIEALQQAFGPQSVALLDYDTASAEGNIMAMFLKAAGLEAAIADAPWLVNPMLPLPDVELVRVMNIRAQAEGLLVRGNVRAAYDGLRPTATTLLHEFDSAMARHARLTVLGNIVCDYLLAQLMANRHAGLFVNALSAPEPRECHVYEDAWLLDRNCARLAEKAYALVRERLTA